MLHLVTSEPSYFACEVLVQLRQSRMLRLFRHTVLCSSDLHLDLSQGAEASGGPAKPWGVLLALLSSCPGAMCQCDRSGGGKAEIHRSRSQRSVQNCGHAPIHRYTDRGARGGRSAQTSGHCLHLAPVSVDWGTPA